MQRTVAPPPRAEPRRTGSCRGASRGPRHDRDDGDAQGAGAALRLRRSSSPRTSAGTWTAARPARPDTLAVPARSSCGGIASVSRRRPSRPRRWPAGAVATLREARRRDERGPCRAPVQRRAQARRHVPLRVPRRDPGLARLDPGPGPRREAGLEYLDSLDKEVAAIWSCGASLPPPTRRSATSRATAPRPTSAMTARRHSDKSFRKALEPIVESGKSNEAEQVARSRTPIWSSRRDLAVAAGDSRVGDRADREGPGAAARAREAQSGRCAPDDGAGAGVAVLRLQPLGRGSVRGGLRRAAQAGRHPEGEARGCSGRSQPPPRPRQQLLPDGGGARGARRSRGSVQGATSRPSSSTRTSCTRSRPAFRFGGTSPGPSWTSATSTSPAANLRRRWRSSGSPRNSSAGLRRRTRRTPTAKSDWP